MPRVRARACLWGAALRLVGPNEAVVLLDNVGKKCRANAYRVADIYMLLFCYFETVPIYGTHTLYRRAEMLSIKRFFIPSLEKLANVRFMVA